MRRRQRSCVRRSRWQERSAGFAGVLQGVRDSLLILLTLLPDRLGTKARLVEVRSILASERALVALREIGAPHLHVLPRPLGFRPAGIRTSKSEDRLQHKTGADPP